ncbi:MAG: CHAP domain-containing protein [Deltaproteobacteria bacterium]|nr:CHAP domain-containing protein [Deltaproteobacteria bacterium]
MARREGGGRFEGCGHAPPPSRLARSTHRAAGTPGAAPRPRAPGRRRPPGAGTRPARAQLPAPRPRAEIAAPAPVASAAPAPRPPTARIAPAPEPPPVDQPLTRPLLGDGSVPGELLAAAQRVLGVRDGFGDRTFLAHLVSVAAVPIEASAPRARYNAAVWEELARSGRTFDAGRPEPGDLAFFHRVDDLDGDGSANDPFSAVAVVERVLPSGVVICIGEVHGEVRRFALDPTRPWVVRDEATGEEVNSTLRRRSLEDPPGTAVLAGGLLAGYARP